MDRISGAIVRVQRSLSVAWMLAAREWVADFRQSRMTPVWPVVQPLAYAVLFVALRPLIGGSVVDRPIEFGVFVFIGFSLWQSWYEGMRAQMDAIGLDPIDPFGDRDGADTDAEGRGEGPGLAKQSLAVAVGAGGDQADPGLGRSLQQMAHGVFARAGGRRKGALRLGHHRQGQAIDRRGRGGEAHPSILPNNV